MSTRDVSPAIESRYADNDGVRIHYVDALPSMSRGATPILFVPGMTDVAADYPTIAELTGRRTLVVELRGHGRSDAPAAGYCFEDHVSDIAAVVDDSGIESMHVMTFSRGTCYALGWIDKNRDRVRSLAIGDYPAREIAFGTATADSLLGGSWRGTAVRDRLDERAARSMFEQARHRPLWDVVRSLSGPVLVVRSGAGLPITDQDWVLYGAVAPAIRRHEFADSPHDIFRPDRNRYPLLVAELVEQAELAAGI